MATEAKSSDTVEAFIQSAEYLTASLDNLNEGDRARVLQKLYETTTKVESPWDTFVRLYITEPSTSAVLKVLKDLRLLEKWRAEGNRPMSAIELAKLTGDECDPELLLRLLRFLAANHLVEMNDDGKFQPARFCVRLTDSDYGALAQFHFGNFMPIVAHMPAFFAKTNYANPLNNRKTMLDSAFGFQGGLFKYLGENPDQGQAFNLVQKAMTSSHTPWTSIFPCQTLLESDSTLPLLVDVGGSIGQDIQVFCEQYPETASRLYLEDQPSVINDENSSVVKGINKLAYNFFQPQPIKHARAYYMHHILHDWSDKLALRILAMQKAAMKPGYSKILIHDHVLSDDKPSHPHAAAYDMLMMVFGSSCERTEKQWKALIEAAGLRLVKIWRTPPALQGVIEVELPEVSKL